MMTQYQSRSYFSRVGTPGLCHVGAADPGELNYNPDHLLDMLHDHLRAKNDAQLSVHLSVNPAVISKIRHKRNAVTADLLIRMHEASGLSIRDLRFLMGDKRRFFRPIELIDSES